MSKWSLHKISPLTLARILILLELVVLAVSTAASSALEILIYLIFIGCASMRKRVFATIGQPMVIMTLGIWAMIGIGISYSAAPLADGMAIWGSWRKCLMLPLAAAVFDDPAWKKRVLWTFIGFMTLSALISFASFFAGIRLLPKFEEVGTVINNHTTQSLFFATAAFACILAIRFNTATRKWMLWTAAAILVANLFFVTTGRSGYLAFVVYLALLILWETRGKLRISLLLSVPVLIGFVFIVSPVARHIIHKGLEEMQTYRTDPGKTSMGLRMVFWQNTLTILETNKHPLIGYGTDGFKEAYAHVVKGQSGWQGAPSTDPHNQYLHILVEHGIIGLVLFLVFIAAFFRQKAPPLYYRLGTGVVMAWCATSLFSGHFSTFHEGHFFFIWCAVMLAQDPMPDKGL